MPEPCVIPCSEVDGDTLTIETLFELPNPECVVHVHDHMKKQTNSLALDEDSARQLFNWLGVWLHTFH